MRDIYFPALFACLFFLSSCFSPRSIIRIHPEAEADVRWNYGQAFAYSKQADLEVQAAFSGFDKNYLIFDLEVTNYGAEEVLVSPEQIRLDASGFQIPAVDPERFLLALDLKASRREATSKNLALAAGAAAVVGTAAIIAGNTDRSNIENNNNADNDAANVAAASIYAGATITSAAISPAPPPPASSVDRWFWSDYTLRKTTLGANERIGGKVLFPRADDRSQMKIIIVLADQIFEFPFEQVIYKP